jgi:glycosyltransferase involved in cell wall biosynthesis
LINLKSNHCVIIPAFNEAKNLFDLLPSVLQQTKNVIIVNDGSKDDSSEILKKFSVIVLNHPVNLGYHEALKTGLLFALSNSFQHIIIFDADGQHQPKDINKILRFHIKNKASLTIGSRFIDPDYSRYTISRFQRIILQIFSFFGLLLTGRFIYDTTSGFQVMNRRVAKFLYINYLTVDYPVGNLILLIQQGFKVQEFPVVMHQRRHGVSMHSSLIYYMSVPPQMLLAQLVLFLRLLRDRIAVRS